MPAAFGSMKAWLCAPPERLNVLVAHNDVQGSRQRRVGGPAFGAPRVAPLGKSLCQSDWSLCGRSRPDRLRITAGTPIDASYSADLETLSRQCATFVDKI